MICDFSFCVRRQCVVCAVFVWCVRHVCVVCAGCVFRVRMGVLRVWVL